MILNKLLMVVSLTVIQGLLTSPYRSLYSKCALFNTRRSSIFRSFTQYSNFMGEKGKRLNVDGLKKVENGKSVAKPDLPSKSSSASSMKSPKAPTKINKENSKVGIKKLKQDKSMIPSEGIRINKCLPSLSRRAADEAVAAGRVTVNDQVILSAGYKVHKNDVVKLDEKKQYWETNVRAKQVAPASEFDEQDFLYIKYWKPVGVTCTSDEKDPNNIISAGKFTMLPQRVFTVGRLDRDSSGLILLTSDGRVNSAFLHRSQIKEKLYEVTTDRSISDTNIQQLSRGIMITTPVQRERSGNRLVTAKTLPCKVSRLGPNKVSMTLVEGRNRQIRRMIDALGLKVIDLHRVSFAGISMKGLSQPGMWKELSTQEMSVIQRALAVSSKTAELKEAEEDDAA